MKRRSFMIGGLIASTLLLAGCDRQRETFRYRLTVEVETPDGLKTGSSVIEVSLTQTGKDAFVTPEAGGVNATMRGEAVAVDLPGGGVLFALLRSKDQVDAAKWYAHRAVKTPRFEGEYASTRRTKYMKENSLSGELGRDLYPMLVTFGDLDDPASVAEVDPEDMAASFGEGVALKRIAVQLTDDPVTAGIEERLGWLEQTRGAIGKIPMSERPPAGTPLPLHATLGETSFRIGER